MKEECGDRRCAKHGSISIRGNVFTGKVVSAKPQKTVVVKREITHYVPKYERYKKISSKIAAHNPECISAKEGDIVRIGETRKLSKTKSFVIMEIVGHKDEEKKEEGFEEAKKVKEQEEEKKKAEKEGTGEKESEEGIEEIGDETQ